VNLEALKNIKLTKNIKVPDKGKGGNCNSDNEIQDQTVIDNAPPNLLAFKVGCVTIFIIILVAWILRIIVHYS